MALIVKPNTFSAGATIVASEHNSNFDTIYNDYNGNITNANVDANAAIVASKLDLTAPGAIGSTTAAAGSFTNVNLPEGSAPTTAASEGALYTKDTGGQPELFFREESNGDEVQLTNAGEPATPVGAAVQVVNTQTGAVNTGTTQIPVDDSIPQITEGDEYMTLAITPTSATNKLKIDIVCYFSWSATDPIGFALFQDTTTDALAAVGSFTIPPDQRTISFTHFMTAGTTSATTFRFRAGGGGGGTFTFNGLATARRFGGVAASSITITEVKV